MAYTHNAIALRRCTGVRKDGSPCRAWARWGCPEQRCTSHRPGGFKKRSGYNFVGHLNARYESCDCAAYEWPHRPGGGFCRWPDPPLEICDTPAGTRPWGRLWRRR